MALIRASLPGNTEEMGEGGNKTKKECREREAKLFIAAMSGKSVLLTKSR